MAGPMTPLILQGIPRLLPMLGGSMYMGSEAPKAIEYLMKKDNEEGKIIPFPKATDNKTPDQEPDKDPDIPPSGIGEVLDLMEERKSKEKPKGKSLFAETYDGKMMENVFRYLTTLGEDTRETLLGVMNTPIETLEEILKKADPYVLRPNKILDLNQIQEIYDKETNRPYEGEGSFENYLISVDKTIDNIENNLNKIENKYGEKITEKESFKGVKSDLEAFKNSREDESRFRSLKKDFNFYVNKMSDDLQKLGEEYDEGDNLIKTVADYFKDYK